MSIEALKGQIKNIHDPRRTSYGNVRHKLEDMIVIGLCTLICGGEDYADMEEFGIEREEFLRQFLELPNGIPDSDTFRRLFERLNPEELSECLYNWLAVEFPERCVIAVDGKTIRGSKNNEHKAYHVVSAFVAENQITLGEITVNEKSNEIKAVPELLDLFYLEDTIITADAMSCQTEIVKKIVSGEADYVISVKKNQPKLYEFTEAKFCDTKSRAKVTETEEHQHGRTEIRTYFLKTNVKDFVNLDKWEKMNAVGMVKTKRINDGEKTESVRYFITSLTDVKEFADAVRKHWAIENQLHWNLDIIFREDSAHMKKDNSPLNMNVLRKIALALLTKAKYGRLSKRKMMFKASLNPEVLLKILLAFSG